MLYKLQKSKDGRYEAIDPLPFKGLPKEKQLEDLIAQNLWDVLFEDNNHMPIFQERVWQPEADIYALNSQGDLVVFELKRDSAGEGAVHQALRYCEKASRFGHDNLEQLLRTYRKDPTLVLREEHRAAFELERPLDAAQFNSRQHLVIIGTAGDTELIRNIDYWKSRGLSIEFIPYRIYRIGGTPYFEFFSLPYDQHSNPGQIKGVIFDTCRKNGDWSLDYMLKNNRVAAYNSQDGCVYRLSKNDVVFLYHKGVGIIAAGRVTSQVKEDPDFEEVETTKYCDLEWLTPKPDNLNHLPSLNAGEIKTILGHGFFWARTIKAPYLSTAESDKLIEALKAKVVT